MNRSLKIYGDGEAPEPFVGPAVSKPTCLLIKSTRSGKEYLEDSNADAYGLKLLQQATSCIQGRPFVFFTSPRPELRSRVRTKKGLLWDYPSMRSLEALHNELEVDDKHTSLTSLVCLDKYDFTDTNTFVTNWYRSVVIVSDLKIDHLFAMTDRWVRRRVKGVVPLDLARMFDDLEKLPSTALIRYFGADNGRDESLAIIGHESLLDETTISCLDLLG